MMRVLFGMISHTSFRIDVIVMFGTIGRTDEGAESGDAKLN